MKITIPDWVSTDETLTLLAGQELVAFKHPMKEWKVKSVRCNQCGNCCLDLSNILTPFGTDDEGKCNKLKKEDDKWLCTAGHQKPFCCISDPASIEDVDCCIRY